MRIQSFLLYQKSFAIIQKFKHANVDHNWLIDEVFFFLLSMRTRIYLTVKCIVLWAILVQSKALTKQEVPTFY